MLKKDLRLKYSSLRKSLSSQDISTKSIQIANSSLQLPIWHFDNYHIFLPITSKKEIDTEPIIAIIFGKDKNVVVPKMILDNQLNHYLITDNTKFAENKWGVPEPMNGFRVAPQKIDIVFIPLLAFDKAGNRVGYGKGYYDAFLKKCKKETIKIGLSLFEAEERIKDVYEDDIPLDYCITPLKTYSFNTD